MSDPAKIFWSKSADELLASNQELLKIQIRAFYGTSTANEKNSLRMLQNAVNSAKQTITVDAKINALEARVQSLESAASMDFSELVLDLALASFGGHLVGFACKKVFSRIFKSRILLASTRSNLRVTGSSISTSQQRAKLNKLRKTNPSKYSKKHDFYDITMIDSVFLDPKTWKSELLEKAPDVIAGLVEDGLQSKGDVQNLKQETTVTASSFFENQVITLTTQITNAEKNLVIATTQLETAFVNNDQAEIRKIVKTIKEANKFEEKNEPKNISANDEEITKLLTQPILLSAVLQMGLFPTEILPAIEPIDPRYLLKGPMFIDISKPERAKGNPAQKAIMTTISKAMLVPELLSRGGVQRSFYHYYGGEKKKRIVHIKLITYLNRIRTDPIGRYLQSIASAILNYQSKFF